MRLFVYGVLIRELAQGRAADDHQGQRSETDEQPVPQRKINQRVEHDAGWVGRAG